MDYDGEWRFKKILYFVLEKCLWLLLLRDWAEIRYATFFTHEYNIIVGLISIELGVNWFSMNRSKDLDFIEFLIVNSS